jgi:hypothetical protein
MKIQERIQKGKLAKEPQRQHQLGAPGLGAIDRRVRREAWEREDAARAAQGLPRRGLIQLPVLPQVGKEESHG